MKHNHYLFFELSFFYMMWTLFVTYYLSSGWSADYDFMMLMTISNGIHSGHTTCSIKVLSFFWYQAKFYHYIHSNSVFNTWKSTPFCRRGLGIHKKAFLPSCDLVTHQLFDDYIIILYKGMSEMCVILDDHWHHEIMVGWPPSDK